MYSKAFINYYSVCLLNALKQNFVTEQILKKYAPIEHFKKCTIIIWIVSKYVNFL